MSGVGSSDNLNTGNENTFIGHLTGASNTTGSSNVYIGAAAGGSNATGHGNVFIGDMAGLEEKGSNKLYIDNCYSSMPCDKPLIKGDFAARTLQIDGSLTMVSIATPSDVRYKKDIQPLESSLEKVLHLQGVTYKWDKDNVYGAGYKDGKQIGFVAQEVEKVLPELVQTDSDGYKALSYDKLVPVLVEAIKEQQKAIDEKSRIVAEQKTALDALTAKFEKLETRLNRLAGRDMSAQK
jgi:uncharacterized coiled-coil protein SlyX